MHFLLAEAYEASYMCISCSDNSAFIRCYKIGMINLVQMISHWSAWLGMLGVVVQQHHRATGCPLLPQKQGIKRLLLPSRLGAGILWHVKLHLVTQAVQSYCSVLYFWNYWLVKSWKNDFSVSKYQSLNPLYVHKLWGFLGQWCCLDTVLKIFNKEKDGTQSLYNLFLSEKSIVIYY